MSERYFSPKSHATVGKENSRQYGETWPWSADIRRHLTLEYSVPKRDMWAEMAKAVVDSGARRIVEYGSSSGYIICKMLEQGYDGLIVGVEQEDSYISVAEDIIRQKFPDTKATIQIVQGDAQEMTLDRLGGELFDAGIAANLLYHVPAPKQVFKSLNEVVKDQGLQFFSTKDVEHQQEIWMVANQLATYVNAEPIQSYYWHFPTSQLDQSIKGSKRFRPLKDLMGEHKGETWIPDNEEGWIDFKLAVLSLVSIMETKGTELPPNIYRCNDMMESVSIKDQLFKREAARNGGFVKGTVGMTWRGCVNHNPGVK